MCKILLSIKPQFVKNILDGTKTYEFRKIKCKEKVDKIIIYSSSPVMRVVAEANVEEVIVDEPKSVWEITKHKSGITKDFFDTYFKDKDIAVAYKLNNIVEYDKPRSLADYGIQMAPQSFVYLKH